MNNNSGVNQSGYKTSHSWNKAGMAGRDDVLRFYNHYLEKMATKVAPEVIIREKPTSDSASLMVIDMQNDFIYLPKEIADSIGKPQGRFCVQNGLSILEPLAKFIETEGPSFTKIVFTRDAHPHDHCSFFTNGGPFPPHCLANHYGAALHPAIKAIGENAKNAVVTFKGCNTKVDSFGGTKYPTNSYMRQRQLGKCCEGMTDDECSAHTGGRYLKEGSGKTGFEDYPFAGIGPYEKNDQDYPIGGNDCPQSTAANIDSNLGKDFEVADLFPGQTSGTHTVYIVGLAADFCVKDTAMNIMKQAQQGINGVKVNVVVIQDLTRYVMLPINLIKGKDGKPKNGANFKKMGEKDINDYLFQYVEGNVRLLSQSEVANAKTNVSVTGKGPDKEFKTALAAFTTPMKSILDDYKSTGVKLLITESVNTGLENAGLMNIKPNVFAGGARRKNKTRKNCWPKRSGGARKGTRKPKGHKPGCKCPICKRR